MSSSEQTVTLNAQIEEVEYELAMRRAVYPRLKAKNPRKRGEYDLHMTRMVAVLSTIMSCRDRQ